MVIYQVGNALHFSIQPSTGPVPGLLRDEDVAYNTVMKINGKNPSVTIGQNFWNNIQTVSFGPTDLTGVMNGESYIGFNMEREPDPNNTSSTTYRWLYHGNPNIGANGGFVVYADNEGSLNFSPKESREAEYGMDAGHVYDDDVVRNRCLQINKSGKVVIGDPALVNINTAYEYGLYVRNGILTEKLRVAVQNTPAWADYVFDKDYKLPSLASVQKHISEKGHLPGVPSACEVVENGFDTGEMTAKLLEKIEELTLYVLQQEKKIAALEKKVKKAGK